MTLLLDSSFVYALFNGDDRNHAAALQFAAAIRQQSLVPDVALPEITFLFRRDAPYSAIKTFLVEFTKAQLTLVPPTTDDIIRISQIMDTYPTAEFDLVDCTIMALAERLNITQICTFDRRDFSIFRPRHCDYLKLLP